MAGLMDYAAMQTDTFSSTPFGVEDAMVFSQLAYLKFDGLVTGPSLLSRSLTVNSAAAASRIGKLTSGISGSLNMREFLEALAINPRFSDVRIKYYANRFSPSAQKQFSAVTFFIPDGSVYIAIRGTDSTLVGWRENLTMAYEYPVPAQEEAVDYLERVAKLTMRKIRIGGHSKGGNLAMYASMNATERTAARIIDVYNLDGPGFADSVLESDGYMRIKDRVQKILPTDSYIGTLLRQGDDFRVVESSAQGLAQHDLFTWLMEDNSLVYASSLSPNAVKVDRTLDRWLAGMDNERRRDIVGTLFVLMDATKALDIDSLFRYFKTDDSRLTRALLDLEPRRRKLLLQEVANLGGAYIGISIFNHAGTADE